MKRLYVLIAALAAILLGFNTTFAQEPVIGVTVIQMEDDCPAEAARALDTKMQQIVQRNGYQCAEGSRFILTARMDVTEKDITSAGMFLQKMDISFYLGDALTGRVFSSENVKAVGVGETETKMLIKAYQSVKADNKAIVKMMAEGKENITSYFKQNADAIIRDAQMQATQGNYDGAMTMLLTVPDFCEPEYSRCQEKALDIYNQKKDAERDARNKENQFLLNKAKSAWASKQNYESAEQALDILAQIDPDADCRPQADAFVAQISSKLRAQEHAQWEWRKKQYEDKMEMSRQAQADKTALLGALIGRFGKLDINIQKESTHRLGFAK